MDIDFFLEPHSEVPTRPSTVISAGDLNGIVTLLDAVDLVRRLGYNLRLEVLGKGSMPADLQRHAKNLDIADVVSYVGQVDAWTLRSKLRRATVLVLPSWSNDFGYALVGAMACGRPVIATRHGIPELVSEGDTGLLVSSGDATEIAQALWVVVQNVNLSRKLGEAARRSIRCLPRASNFRAFRLPLEGVVAQGDISEERP